MTKPKGVRWKLERQTVGKHRVLEEYLKAWFPILGATRGPILFIDGFAGPGRYSEEEEGSPLIALRTFRSHASAPAIRGPVRFMFIEKDEQRFNALEAEIASLKSSVPENAEIYTYRRSFADVLDEQLSQLEALGTTASTPVLCMADPFGPDGIPLAIFARILRRPSAELYITIMQSFIDRFGDTEEFAAALRELFGGDDWKPLLDIHDLDERRRAYFSLYERKLRESGARFVLRFDLFDANRFVYSIFFASNHSLGCERMKDAIWRVIPDGGFQYRDRDQKQLMLDVVHPRIEVMEAQVLSMLAARGPQSCAALEEWARGDETMFRRSVHLRAALKNLEKSAKVAVDRTNGTKFSDLVVVSLRA